MITVIVPAKDAEKTLGGCLQALQNQAGLRYGVDYEVIVVDDGSMDRTCEIAEAYSVRIARQPNTGPASARNTGAKIASGTLLAFTDADCVPTPDWLRNLTQPFNDLGVVGVKGAYLTRQVGLVSRFVQLEYEYKEARMRGLPAIDFIDTFSAAYRRDVFLQNGGFDETFRQPAVEDIEFSFRLARKGYRMVFEPGATVYHQHDRNIAEYLNRKGKIGFWGAYMLRWTAERLLSDTHTAPTQRIEIILLALSLVTIPFLFIWPGYAALTKLLALLLFLLVTVPFQVFIAKKDSQVLSVASFMLLVRAAALGYGLLRGFLLPPSLRRGGLPCQDLLTRVVKRFIDITSSTVGLILTAPLIACATLAIRLDSKGPVICKQLRAGEFGKPFTIYKLRTMVDGADKMIPKPRSLSVLKSRTMTIPDDLRVTRVGRILRRWKLDKLPQFWNVFKGDMSLVGPLPELMCIVEQYTDDQRQCLMVKPGLTGPVQVNGRGGLDFDQRIRLEIDYLKGFSLIEDLKIIFKTIPVIITGEGII